MKLDPPFKFLNRMNSPKFKRATEQVIVYIGFAKTFKTMFIIRVHVYIKL